MIKTVVLSSILAAFLGAGAANAQEYGAITWGGVQWTNPESAPSPVRAPAHRQAKVMAMAGGATHAAQPQTFQAFGHTFDYPNSN